MLVARIVVKMKLYEYSITRSIRCRWLLEELGIEFESVEVDLSKGKQNDNAFRAVNPFAKVPALIDGDLTLFESAAICTYLSDKYPDLNFIPAVGTKERALHDQWMYFCMAELESPLWAIAKHTFIYDEHQRSPAAIELAKDDFLKIVRPLESHMTNRAFVLGNKFQTVDVLIGQTLIWAFAMRMTKHHSLLTDCPALVSYLRRLSERPKMPGELKSILVERLREML
jgi:glutathione S-transferase